MVAQLVPLLLGQSAPDPLEPGEGQGVVATRIDDGQAAHTARAASTSPPRLGKKMRVGNRRQAPRALHAPVEAAGLPEDLTPHELRHTAAALLIATGAGPKSIQAQLGHSTIATTFDIYGHPFGGHLDEVMDRLDHPWHQEAESADASSPLGQVEAA